LQQEVEEVSSDVESKTQAGGEHVQARAAELAAIAEASPSPSRRGKRRAALNDEHSLERAERLKAIRNEGDVSSDASLIHLPVSTFTNNLGVIGICLGSDNVSISNTVHSIKEAEFERSKLMSVVDVKNVFLENQEKEIAEEEHLDNFILTHLCEDIMEEVMDGRLTSDCISSGVFQKSPSGLSKKKVRQQSK